MRMVDVAPEPRVPDSLANELLQSGLGQLEAGDFRGAIEAFQSALRRRTDYPAAAHAYSGVAWISLKNFRRAIQQLSRAVNLDPRGQVVDDPAYYRRWRGHAFVGLFRYRKALADFCFIAKLGASTADDLSTLGFLYRLYGRYSDAVAAYESALAIDRDNYYANHNLAYILATCKAATFRDGLRAMQIATNLNERSRYGNWSDLSLLAAAHAEVGDFDQAVEFARLSAAYSPPGAERERLQRIRQYERKRPLRSWPWLDRYRYRLQAKWLAKQDQSSRRASTHT
jgi:tetratricopeptide (TPR) repeat protein